MLLELWPTTWSVPLGPTRDTVYSQMEELESLVASYGKALTYQNQVTIAIKHDTGRVVRITTEIEQPVGHRWYDILSESADFWKWYRPNFQAGRYKTSAYPKSL